VTGDRQGDWPERQAPRHSGRHSRVSREDNGTDPRVVPGQYGPPDPRRPYVAPDQHAPQDPYAYGRPDPYAAPDAYTTPDAYTAPDAYSGPDGYAAPGAHAAPDGYAAPGAYHPADGQTPTDAYALTDRYSVPGPAVRPNPPHPPQAYRQPGYPGQEPFGPAGDPRDTRGGLAGLPEQNGYGRPDAHGQSPPRWPSPGAAGPQGLTGAPGRGGGTDREPQPGSRDWDSGPGQDWDAGQESGGFASLRRSQDTGPRPQPPTGPRPARPGPRPQAGPPQQQDNSSSPAGLIPGFWDSSDSRRSRPRRPVRRVGWVLAPLLALALLCALAVAGYDVYKGFQSKDFTGPGFGHVTVQVLPGDTATSLAPRLVKLGVVASAKSFISAAKQNSNPAGLEPGFFALHKHMNSALAYQMLLNPASRIQTVVAIPEGLRMSEILTALEKKYPNIPASTFTAATKDTAALGLPGYAHGNPEGYLFPATYDFSPGISAAGMLQAMVARFNQEATTIDLPAAAQAAHLTEGQVITVASIIQAEAGPKYYRQVAEVIYNRLNHGMKLGMQSTVNYALHRSGPHFTASQLRVNSPYNTYIHTGLPPGPIDNPGAAAIEAALHPDHGNLLYFVTVDLKTGLTKFTSSNAQFQQFVAECRQNSAC
jgi:UPF0755 protein